MKYFTKQILVCTALVLALILGISAATLDEMNENGAVSDGGISFGDARDGVVSDVSDKGEGIVPEISSAIDDGLGIGSDSMAPDTSNDPLMGGIGDGVGNGNGASNGTSDTSRTTSDAANNTTQGANDKTDKGGMSAGLIIAILVVVAVVVIIFILLPKRR